MTMCKMRSIETNREIKKSDANIVKNEIKKNEASHEKISEFKNKNFINFFKVKCHRCHKNEHYAQNCVEFELIKKSSKKA